MGATVPRPVAWGKFHEGAPVASMTLGRQTIENATPGRRAACFDVEAATALVLQRGREWEDTASLVQIAAFQSAVDAVGQALTAESLAATRLESAEEAWNVLLTKVYGVLVGDVGKTGAERFFPKGRRSKKKTGE